MKKLLYFAIFTSFFAAQIFTFSIGPVQMSLFRGAIILLGICMAFQMLKSDKVRIKSGKNRSFSLLFFFFWLLYAFFTIIWAKDLWAWFRAIYFLGAGVLTAFLASRYLTSESDFDHAFLAFRLGIAMQCVIGWYEVFSRNYFFINSYNQEYYTTTTSRIPIAMCGNPNDFATLMLFGTFLFYASAKASEKIQAKLFNALLCISCGALLFLTQSRANILGFFMALIYICWQDKHRVLLFSSVIMAMFALSPARQYLETVLQFHFVNATTGSDIVRTHLIQNGLNFLVKTFGFGTGAGQIEYWMRNKSIYYTGGIQNMHNWWAELLCGYGIVVFIGYLVFYIKMFLDMHRFQSKTQAAKHKAWALGIGSCMVGFVIGGVSSSSNIVVEWLWCFWAISISYQNFIYQNKVQEKEVQKIA